MSGAMLSSKGVVTNDYICAYPVPIELKVGEDVLVSHCDLEWQGWIWVTGASGISGWVPQQILSFIDEIHAKSLENYIARELSVVKGDSLHVEQLLNGWYWVRNIADQTGWVPQENIELIV